MRLIILLVKKEIRESLFEQRFLTISVLILIVIPLSLYLGYNSYTEQMEIYSDNVAKYNTHLEDIKNYNFIAEGYRPPLFGNIYSQSTTKLIPNQVKTSNTGRCSIENYISLSDTLSSLFGHLDFSIDS